MLHGRFRMISLGALRASASAARLSSFLVAASLAAAPGWRCRLSAMSREIGRPSTLWPCSCSLADWVSSASVKVTKPNPREDFVCGSTTTVACLTGKCCEKKSVKVSVVV
ncbi:hypothetical protein F5B17DRAFT_418740 [Nemania serpens]|nr:hypothetical protein F5B17DRAFT_418740 [Nemania serpens]